MQIDVLFKIKGPEEVWMDQWLPTFSLVFKLRMLLKKNRDQKPEDSNIAPASLLIPSLLRTRFHQSRAVGAGATCFTKVGPSLIFLSKRSPGSFSNKRPTTTYNDQQKAPQHTWPMKMHFAAMGVDFNASHGCRHSHN